VFPVIVVELGIFGHVDVHCNLLFVIIDMKGKYACLADFLLLQKKEGGYSRLIRENKIAGIVCRVAASSNKANSADAKKPRG